MLTKLFLALRNNGHRVDVVKVNGEPRPVLGRSHPEEEDRRANILRQWGIRPESPRHQPLGTIDEPLSQRTQTILSHQLPPELRARLNGAPARPAESRKKNGPGRDERVFLRQTGEED